MNGLTPRPNDPGAADAVALAPQAAVLAPPEATFRAMAEAMPQLVWSTTPDGYHDYFNARWYAFTGMPRPGEPGGEGSVAQGWHWKDYLHPDDYDRTVARWAHCLATGDLYEIEYRFKEAATGAYRWFLARAVPLRDEGGRITRWFGTCTDVDAAKRTEGSLALLARAGTALGATLDVEEALAAVARLAVPDFADWCAVDLPDGEPGAAGGTGVRRIAVAHVDPAKVALARAIAERYPQPADATQGVRHVLRTGEPELVAEIPDALLERGAHDAEHLAVLRALGLCSYIAVPMLAVTVSEGADGPPGGGAAGAAGAAPRVVGCLSFVSAEGGRRYGAADLETATELARRASLAFERARLHGAVQRDRARLTEQAEELTVQNEQLQQQAAELEMQSAQLQEQATELEIAHEHLREQAAELEAGYEALQARSAELVAQAAATDRARREAERVAAERDAAGRQLTAVLEQSPMGIAVAEAPSGRVLFVNRRTHELFGRRSGGIHDHGADWTGVHAEGPLAGEAVAPEAWPLARAVARGEVVAGEVVEVRHGDGDAVFVSINAGPVRDEAGAVVAGVATFQDVTAARRAGAEVERARAEAEAARRRAEEANRAKSEFLAAMSHELRTPLNAIAGYAELMELGLRGPVTEEQRGDLARIRRSQRHLLTLITDILNFARLEGGRVEYDLRPVPLADLIADAAPMIEPQLAAQHLSYEVRLPAGADGGGATARADQEKVRQILLNLLSNAAKFTPAGGRVTVAVEAAAGALGGAAGGAVLVRVSDTGIGIPADKLDAIFDPFVQVQTGLTRRHEGTGLGLAISRDLARGMGGDLTVESAPGAGSTFTLVLPRA